VIAPAIVGEGATTVTPIPPEEPGETPPITIEFENVTNGGTISVVSTDPLADPDAPAPPAGFSLGDACLLRNPAQRRVDVHRAGHGVFQL